MPSRVKLAPKRKSAKPAPKKANGAKRSATKTAAARKSSASAPVVAARSPAKGTKPSARPIPLTSAAATVARVAAAPKPPARPMSAAQVATAQQAEERRKAATRKLFARIRSLEAILGADLRKRGSLLLSQAVDQWYAEATSATATEVSITNAARAVISQL